MSAGSSGPSSHTQESRAAGEPSKAKPLPRVPADFCRAAFHPAQYALTLLTVPEPRRAAVVAKLTRTRDALAAVVADSAPDWPTHVETVSELTTVFGITQSAATVAERISTLTLHQSASADDEDGSAEMAEVLARIELSDAKLALLASVRELALLADDAEHAAAAGHRDSQARLLGSAIAAANTSPLALIAALDPTRRKLDESADALHKVLASAIADGLFTDIVSEQDQRRQQMGMKLTRLRNVSLDNQPSSSTPRSFAMQSAEALHAEACHAAHQLLKLRGLGAVSDAIEKAALCGCVDSLLHAALDSASPLSTESLASHLALGGGTGGFFSHGELGVRGRTGRPLCGVVVSELARRVRSVMDRVVHLSADVPDVVDGRPSVVAIVWRIVEVRIVSLVHALLGIGAASVPVLGIKEQAPSLVSSSMLPSPRRSPSRSVQLIASLDDDMFNPSSEFGGCIDSVANVNSRGTGVMDGSRARGDDVADDEEGWINSYVASLPGVEPGIYNLAVMYEALLSIASHGAGADSTTPYCSGEERGNKSCNLLTLLELAGKLLVDTVRQDITAAVGPVLARRSALLTDDGHLQHAVQPHRLHVADDVAGVAPIVADILELASLVPSAGPGLGTALADLVLTPLATQYTKVLDVLASRTSAGPVYDRVVVDNPTLTARDVIFRRNHTRPVSLDAVLVLYARDAQAENFLLREEDWMYVVESIVSVSSLTSEVRRCVGHQGIEAAGDAAMPLVQFRSRVKGYISSAATPKQTSPRSPVSPVIPCSGARIQRQNSRKSRSKTNKPMVSAARDAVTAGSRAVSAAEHAMAALEVAVVDRALVLLHADVMTRCYARAYSAMHQISSLYAAPFAAGSPSSSSASPAAQTQPRLLDCDEFGDPIETDAEDFDDIHPVSSNLSALFLQQSNNNDNSTAASPVSVDLAAMTEQAAAAGRTLGQEMLWVEAWTKHNLPSTRHEFVCGDAAMALAAGLEDSDPIAAAAFVQAARDEGSSSLRVEAQSLRNATATTTDH
jgi:hypothetical protein